jgi:alpha-beta hydrolase superfamily lysophospholipase
VHVPWEVNNPPVLIMAHGFTDDKVSDNRIFVRFARKAREKGYAVLRFDFAGSGDSEGDFSDMTVTKEIQDLKSALEFAHSIPLLTESPIYLVGYSLGGAVALSLAAMDHRVKGVVCWAPASDLRSVFSTILGEGAILTAQRNKAVACRNDSKCFYLKSDFFFDLGKHRPARDIAQVSPRPVLLVQGTADTKVPPGHVQALFKAAGEPKTLHFIRGAQHSFGFHEEELFETTLRHLDAWSRDIWYGVEGHDLGASSVSLHLPGRA